MLSEQSEIKLLELFKICTKCKIPKTWEKFGKEKQGRFGIKSVCRICSDLYSAQYRKTNLEQIALREKKYHQDNLEQIKIDRKQYYEKNKERIKIYRQKHKGSKSAYNKIYRQKNFKRLDAYNKVYKKNHKAKLGEARRKNDRKRRQIDSKYRLTRNIKCLIYNSLKSNKNGRHWEDLVGYKLKDFMKRLQKQFVDGMTWGNYGKGGWVIDHKIPVSAFNFTKPEHRDFKRCWALKNLQPMWAIDNLEKRAKLTKHFQPMLLL